MRKAWGWVDRFLVALPIAGGGVAVWGYFGWAWPAERALDLFLATFVVGQCLRDLPRLRRLPLWGRHLLFRWRFAVAVAFAWVGTVVATRLYCSAEGMTRGERHRFVAGWPAWVALCAVVGFALVGDWWHRAAVKGRLTQVEAERGASGRGLIDRILGF